MAVNSCGGGPIFLSKYPFMVLFAWKLALMSTTSWLMSFYVNDLILLEDDTPHCRQFRELLAKVSPSLSVPSQCGFVACMALHVVDHLSLWWLCLQTPAVESMELCLFYAPSLCSPVGNVKTVFRHSSFTCLGR